MSHSSQVEIERKYDVGEGVEVPDVIGARPIAVVEAIEIIELTAVYFDTTELDLARGRTALRRREGGSDAGWHIKSKQPADEGRTELHWPLETGDGGPDEVPVEVRAEVEHLAGEQELRPVARIVNHRENRRLLDAAGYPVAELSDDHVSAQNLIDGSKRTWREWEVELLAAAPDTRTKRAKLLDSIESILLDAGAEVSASSSKLARALGIDVSA